MGSFHSKANNLVTLLLIILVANSIIEANAAKSLAPLINIKLSNSEQLRNALYSGEPHILLCKTKGNEHEQFISAVRKKIIAADEKSTVTVGIVDCDSPIPSLKNKKSLKSLLKLNHKKNTFSAIWCVNGNKPIQLQPKYYATVLKDDKGKETGQAKLNPSKLAKYVTKYSVAKVLKIKSQANLKAECFDQKYQTCALAVHKGLISTPTTNMLKRLANANRNVRFFTLDSAVYDFSIQNKLPKVDQGKAQIVVFKKRDLATSSHLFSKKDIAFPEIAFISECLESGDEDCEIDDSKRHDVSVSRSLQELLKLPIGTDDEVVHSVFKTNMIDSKKEMMQSNFKAINGAERSNLVFKISMKSIPDVHGDKFERVSYFLDWQSMEPYFISHTVFSHGLSVKKIASLQQDTWKRLHGKRLEKAKKTLAVSAKAYRGSILNNREVDEFFEQLRKESMELSPLAKLPTLKKRATSKPKTSTSKPMKVNTKIKKKTESKPSQDQVELERQKRMEMEEEAKQNYAEYAETIEPMEDAFDNEEQVDEIVDLDDDVLDLDDVVDLDDGDDETLDLDDDEEEEL